MGSCCTSASGGDAPTGRPCFCSTAIGANLELVHPLLEALDQPEAVIFDVPVVGGSPPPTLP